MAGNLNDLVNQTAQSSGLDPAFLAAVISQESQGKVNTESPTHVRGIMQITHGTWNDPRWNQGIGPYSTDPEKQLLVGSRILAAYQAKYTDPRISLLAYNAGEAAGDKAQKLVGQGYSFDAASKLSLQYYYSKDPAKQREATNYPYLVLKKTGKPIPNVDLSAYNDASTSDGEIFGVDDTDVAIASMLTGEAVDAATSAALTPQVIVHEGLDENPWYADPALLTGNPALRRIQSPVSFQVTLDETGYLSNSQGVPISVQLNASLTNYEITYAHVVNKEEGRTAMHLTFWGQQPDMITGSATTGLMMNQLGISSFLSIGTIPDDVRQQILKSFRGKVGTMDAKGAVTGGLPGNISAAVNAFQDGGLRIAAQDAFQELLYLFKMNGVVWFGNDKYQDPSFAGGLDPAEQVSPTAWSAKTGATNFEMNARNNDVMTRGQVIFNFRNTVMMGYFKSLTWTIDANKPFSWNFNFVFQVERTITRMYLPLLSTITKSGGSDPLPINPDPNSGGFENA